MFKGLCQPFIYNGCEGNDNRFESASACRKACSSSEKRDPWVLGKLKRGGGEFIEMR